jgi:hypothetical protein
MAPPSKPNKGHGASDEAVTSDIRRGLFVFSAANSGRTVRRKPSPSAEIVAAVHKRRKFF